jgi:hypothetical protein
MALLSLSADGQKNIPIDDQIARDPKKLKDFLGTFYDLENADITTEEKEGTTFIKIIKRAGSKGSNLAGLNPARVGGDRVMVAAKVLNELSQAPQEINPALLLAWELHLCQAAGTLDIPTLLTRYAQLREAISQGKQQVLFRNSTLAVLKTVPPAGATRLWPGF